MYCTLLNQHTDEQILDFVHFCRVKSNVMEPDSISKYQNIYNKFAFMEIQIRQCKLCHHFDL